MVKLFNIWEILEQAMSSEENSELDFLIFLHRDSCSTTYFSEYFLHFIFHLKAKGDECTHILPVFCLLLSSASSKNVAILYLLGHRASHRYKFLLIFSFHLYKNHQTVQLEAWEDNIFMLFLLLFFESFDILSGRRLRTPEGEEVCLH